MLFTRLGIVPDKSLRSGYWNINGIRMRKEMKFSFFTIGEEPIIYSLLLLLLLGATVASDVEMWMLMDPTNFLSLSRLPKKKSQQQTDREKRDNSSKQRQRLFSFCVLRRLTFDGRPESLVTISLTRSNSPVLYIYTFPHAKTSFLLLPSNRQEQWYWTSILFLFMSFPICCCCLHFGVSNDAIAREKKNMRVFLIFFPEEEDNPSCSV